MPWQKCVWETHVLVFVLTVLSLQLVKMILSLSLKKNKCVSVRFVWLPQNVKLRKSD